MKMEKEYKSFEEFKEDYNKRARIENPIWEEVKTEIETANKELLTSGKDWARYQICYELKGWETKSENPQCFIFTCEEDYKVDENGNFEECTKQVIEYMGE